MMRKIFRNKLVVYCLIAPSIGGFIFILYMLLTTQMNKNFYTHNDLWSGLLFPLLGSPVLGLVYCVPAFITYIFSELLFFLKFNNKATEVGLILIFGGIASMLFTLIVLPYSSPSFRLMTFFIGIICSGVAEYISYYNRSLA